MRPALAALLAAALLDAWIGDPPWPGHPVRRIGALCAWLERVTRARLTQRPGLAGALTVAAVLVISLLATAGPLALSHQLAPGLEWGLAALLLYTCLAARDLRVHAEAVYTALRPPAGAHPPTSAPLRIPEVEPTTRAGAPTSRSPANAGERTSTATVDPTAQAPADAHQHSPAPLPAVDPNPDPTSRSPAETRAATPDAQPDPEIAGPGAPNLALARARVGRIVGRDTAELDEAGIARAAVESVAENMSDGVIAPLFYAAAGALLTAKSPLAGALSPAAGAAVGALLYKATNTMDSMFGYKNERYLRFGWAAARLDDLASWLPARLSALAIITAAPLCGQDGRQAWRVFWRDRRQHASPNAGHPEAAMAGALGVQLGGPARYFGQWLTKPTLGDPRRPITAEDIRRAHRLMTGGSALFTVGVALLIAALIR